MKSIFTFAFLFCFLNVHAQWELVKGEKYDTRAPRYSTLNQPSTFNSPGGSRSGSATWIYNNELYLYGGGIQPFESYGTSPMNDLWKYNKTTAVWTWIKGGNLIADTGYHGTKYIQNPLNHPSASINIASWRVGDSLYLYNGEMWVYDMPSNNWTWIEGTLDNPVVYGQLGIEDSLNNPNSRRSPSCWVYNGFLYMFGGVNSSQTNGTYYYNDVWRYNTNNNLWSCVNASSYPGTIRPSQRESSNGWYLNGKYYLYGGYSPIYASGYAGLSDFWVFDCQTNLWSIIGNPSGGHHGILNVTTSSNHPGSRFSGNAWTTGNKLYLFGGSNGINATKILNDLFEYDLSNAKWTWVGGSSANNQTGVYNVKNVTASTNQIGARKGGLSWQDGADVYIMSGFGYSGYAGYTIYNNAEFLDDLWKYNTLNKKWTWLDGNDNCLHVDESITIGAENNNNAPGFANWTAFWSYQGNNYSFPFWGSEEYAYILKNESNSNNTIWRYNASTNNWALLKKTQITNGDPIYGSINIEDSLNTPGSRHALATWSSSNKLYLFGGLKRLFENNYYTQDTLLNDLWEYNKSTNNWRWIKGSQVLNQHGVYGTLGIPDINNQPGARKFPQYCQFNNKLYLFGGYGYGETGGKGLLNDLWEFDPQTNMWTWLKGSKLINQLAYIGPLEVFGNNYQPSGRMQGSGWALGNKLYFTLGKGLRGQGSFNAAESLLETWAFDLGTNNWAVLRSKTPVGPMSPNDYGVYGTMGIPNPNNFPGGRMAQTCAVVNGNAYLYGGYGEGAGQGLGGNRSDFWNFNTTTNNFTWIGGNQAPSILATYAESNLLSVSNPGSRFASKTWAWGNYYYLFDGTYGQVWRYNLCDSNTICYTNPPVVDLGSDTTICDNSFLVIDAGNYGSAFLWSTGDTTQSIGVASTGTYWVKVTNLNNQIAMDTIHIQVVTSPQMPFYGNMLFCEGGSVILDAANPGMQYLWSTGETTQTKTVDTTGIYTVTVTNANGCAENGLMDIWVQTLPQPGLEDEIRFCENSYVTIYLPYDQNYTYLWSNSSTSSSQMFTNPGIFSVEIIDQFGCIGRDTTNIILDTFTFSLSPTGNIEICVGDSLLLNPPIPAGYSYIWQFNGTHYTSTSFTVAEQGICTLFVTSPYGCYTYDIVNISIDSLPSADSFSVVKNDLTVNFSIQNLQNATTYRWLFGDGDSNNTNLNPVHTYSSGGIYNAQLILSNHCGNDTVSKVITLETTDILQIINEEKISIFPNPASKTLYIQSKNALLSEICLFDILGREIICHDNLKSKKTALSIKGLAAGMYNLRITTNLETINKKVEIVN